MPSISTLITVNSSQPSSISHALKSSFDVRSSGRILALPTSTGSRERKPAPARRPILAAYPGYLSVFSTISGQSMVKRRLLSPSVTKASRVPTPGRSTSSTSDRAAFSVTAPPLITRAGLVYSSSTSTGLKGATYSHGSFLTLGRPPTSILRLDALSRSDLAFPENTCDRPGATPKSTTAVTPFSLASGSSIPGSSGMNAMSTTSVPDSMTELSVERPM